MSKIFNATLRNNEVLVIPLKNTKPRRGVLKHQVGKANEYTVHVTGGFGGGTVTAFTNPQGVEAAKAGTTHDVAIRDTLDVAVSLSAARVFNFRCNSDDADPVVLKLVHAGGTGGTVHVRVDNAE